MLELLENTQSVWERLKTCGKPVVLYGMGDGADKVLAAFEKYGIEASGVMASDDFVRGQSFHGFRVKKLSELEQEFGDFVIALCFASQLPDVMAHIKEVAQKHRTLVPSVPVFGDILFDRGFIEKYREGIEAAYDTLEDDLSRRVYENVIKFYLTGEIGLLDEITTDKDEAFGNILRLGNNELYVDLGAYNGDTIDEFLSYSGGSYRKIVALEPNGKNFKQTQVAAVDTILCGAAATYIKADVEGADFETLIGAKNTLKNFKPKLNFSAYHRFEDIFRLPLLIKKLNPDYKIYLRHHPYIPAWDTNLYCI